MLECVKGVWLYDDQKIHLVLIKYLLQLPIKFTMLAKLADGLNC